MLKTVTITDIIGTQTLMGRIRGDEVWQVLSEAQAKLVERDMLLLDLTGSLFLDYDFVWRALGPFFVLDRPQSAAQIFFLLNRSDERAFFHGVLKHLDLHRSTKYSESRNAFIANGLYCKQVFQNENEVQFVGAISENDAVVLETVNRKKKATASEVAEGTGFALEVVVDSLRELVKKGFVFDLNRGVHDYVSYQQIFKGESAWEETL